MRPVSRNAPVPSPAPVAVAISDSPSSRTAMFWAIEEAQRRGVRLELVHAVPVEDESAGSVHGIDPTTSLTRGNIVLGAAMRLTRLIAPDLPMSGMVEPGGTTDVLARAARTAAMIVVGAHGPGSCVVPGGTLARRIAERVTCRVVATQRSRRPTGPIVAGIDGSAESEVVLEAALDEAAVRRAPLVITWALQLASTRSLALAGARGRPIGGEPGGFGSGDGDAGASYEAVASAATETVSELLKVWGPKYPTVTTSVQVMGLDPVRALIRSSLASQLIVVGAGRSESTEQGLGRVARSILDGAQCPVMIVRARS